MTRSPPSIPRNGFTLVELLVALFVFGLMATAGVYLLSSSADGQAILSQRLAENSELVRAATLLRNDLASAIDRPSRGVGGAPVGAFVTGGVGTGGLFAFSALSTPMEDSGAQPDVERIGYAFDDGALVRYVWPMPDGSDAPVGARMSGDLGDVAVRYRDDEGAWSENWTATALSDLPRAVELTMTGEDGVATRVVATVGTQVRPPERVGQGDTDSEDDADDENASEEDGA